MAADLDEILVQLGQFGKYQIITYALISLPIIFSGITSLTYVFTAGNVPYRCRIPECADNESDFQPPWLNFTMPQGDHTDCLRYVSRNSSGAVCSAENFLKKTTRCHEWVFEGSDTTIMREWNLTCADNQWKLTLVGTVNSLGQFLGLPLVGYFSDRWGRKDVLVGCLVLTSLLGVARSFSPNYIVFVVMEFVNMIVSGSILFGSAFVIGMEMVGPDRRVLGGVIINSLDAVGEVLLGLLAWWLEDWRHLLLVIYAPAILFVSYYWLLPESVRWLLARGRLEEAAAAIRKAASINGVELSDHVLDRFLQKNVLEEEKSAGTFRQITDEKSLRKVEDVELGRTLKTEQNSADRNHVEGRISPNSLQIVADEKHSVERKTEADEEKPLGVFKQVFKSRVLLLRLLNCCFCWITNTFVYFGLSLNSVAVGSNKYSSFILVCVIELPGYMLTYFLLGSRLGRKTSLCVSLLLSGVCCILFIFVPTEMEWVGLSLFLLGKFSITVAFTTIYMYTAELFPTSLRHSLLGVCSMFGRLGSIVAPQTPLLEQYMKSLPLLLFGAMAITSGLLALFFPETKGTRLPDTVEEAERIGDLRDAS